MKKMISIITVICLLLITTSVGAVVPPEDAAQGVPIENVDIVKDYALNFMQTSQKSDRIDVDSIEEMYDLNGAITGYYVVFVKDNTPAGYMVISLLTEGNPVVDFSLEGKGIYEMDELKSSTDGDKNKLIYTGPDCIYRETGTNELYSIFERKSVSKEAVDKKYVEFTENSTKETGISRGGEGSIYDGVIDWDDAGLDTSTVFKINDFGAGTDYWLMTEFSTEGVCAPTAGTNILWYWGYGRGASNVTNPLSGYATDSDKATYIFDTLYDGMGTTSIGGTWDTNVPDGYEEYFGESAGNGKWNYATISDGSAYSVFKTALDDQCPIHLQVRMSTNPFTTNGHDLFNFGYASGTDGTKYLFVMDGWYTRGRFVKFDYYPVVKGYKIWVNTN